MPDNQLTAVAMSGGVDSSTVAAMLRREGRIVGMSEAVGAAESLANLRDVMKGSRALMPDNQLTAVAMAGSADSSTVAATLHCGGRNIADMAEDVRAAESKAILRDAVKGISPAYAG